MAAVGLEPVWRQFSAGHADEGREQHDHDDRWLDAVEDSGYQRRVARFA